MKRKGSQGMAKQKPNRKSWITQQLRRLSMKWPPRGRAAKLYRRELPRKLKQDGTPYKKPNYEYQCQECNNWFRSSDTVMDHIVPVVSPHDIVAKTEEEFIGKFAVSLLCYEDNWQRLCCPCHDIKTENENKIRKDVKKVDKSV